MSLWGQLKKKKRKNLHLRESGRWVRGTHLSMAAVAGRQVVVGVAGWRLENEVGPVEAWPSSVLTPPTRGLTYSGRWDLAGDSKGNM